MATLCFRLFGPADIRDRVLERIEGIDAVERAEEVADLMPHMDDADSSSAGLAESEGAEVFAIEVEVENDEAVELVRRVAEIEARDAGGMLEFVDGF